MTQMVLTAEKDIDIIGSSVSTFGTNEARFYINYEHSTSTPVLKISVSYQTLFK